MEFKLDFSKVKKIIGNTPEAKPLLNDKTDEFKHLYETVYLPLLNEPDEEYVRLHVDLSRFTFDDLAHFNDFIVEKCKGVYNSPIELIDGVITRLPPVIKPTMFI